jgi:3-methylcrotonyl-CoA carboxylase beta subunit
MWMWPNARISVMGGEQAAGVLTTVRQGALVAKGKAEMTEAEIAEFQKPILEKYENEGSAYYSTARLWDDGIIDPKDTRKILGLALEASLGSDIEDVKFGVFRM